MHKQFLLRWNNVFNKRSCLQLIIMWIHKRYRDTRKSHDLHCFVNSLSVTDKNSLFKEIIKCILFNYACMHLTLHVYNLLVLNIGDLVYLSFVMIHYTVQTYSLVQLKLILFNFNCLSNNLRFLKVFLYGIKMFHFFLCFIERFYSKYGWKYIGRTKLANRED